MRALLYVVGAFLPFLGGVAELVGGDTNNSPAEMAAHTILAITVAVGAYLLILGGHYGRKRTGGVGVLLGQVVAYLVGAGLLLPGTALTSFEARDLLAYAFWAGPDPMAHVNRGFFLELLLLGPVLMCSGVAVLIVAGRIGVTPPKTG